MMVHAKRWLFLVHRWLGVLLCAFFAMWFVSGVVMMYVGYPKLTPAERLMHLPPLRGAAVALEPDQALAAAGLQGPLRDLRLAVASGGRAVYLATPQPSKAAPPGDARPRGAPVVIDARTGAVLTAVDAPRALASAAAYAQGPAHAVHEGTLQEDAFTHSRALDMHRPLHRVRLGDAHDTVLYISGTTGEVVRDATRTERQWNYAGAWLHWLYPLRGGLVDRYWADIVNALSLLGIAAVVTGGVIGILRWRFAGTYRSGRRTPFPSAWARWHHVAGLLFMVVTLAWIFSGLTPAAAARRRTRGRPAAGCAHRHARTALDAHRRPCAGAGAASLWPAHGAGRAYRPAPRMAAGRAGSRRRPAGRCAAAARRDPARLRRLLLHAGRPHHDRRHRQTAARAAAGVRRPARQLGAPGPTHGRRAGSAGPAPPHLALAVRPAAQLGLAAAAAAPAVVGRAAGG
ncbi:MAG: hypothetical protein DI574_13015, partial [Acidovorax sp.]